MKVSVVQIHSEPGNIPANIIRHSRMINKAAARGADIVVFPELSLTGYTPSMAKALATDQTDPRLREFEILSCKHDMVIAVGLPTVGNAGIHISLVVFQPDGLRWTYSKQFLHSDEEQFFVPGKTAGIIDFGGARAALAICYEASRREHAEQADALGAEVYIASVADSKNGAQRAFRYLPSMASSYGMPVLMANFIGPCEGFEAVGQSSVWDSSGELQQRLSGTDEGILLFNTETCVTDFTLLG